MTARRNTRSLKARGHILSNTFHQLDVLNGYSSDSSCTSSNDIPAFQATLDAHGIDRIKPLHTEILQINIGKKCNQTCAHCHVDAGPDREEMMSRHTMEQCLNILRTHPIEVVDITGGAPELHPDFRRFVSECHKLGKRIIDRCNLTIIVSNPRFHDLPEFFAAHHVQVIASLPHFGRNRTDSQRGAGVFDASIRALQMLNAVGYGVDGSALQLDLVYNPTGAFLPAGQKQLEQEFKSQLQRRYGIAFNRLYTITNMPVSRFLDYLLESGNYEDYMTTLCAAFNPASVEGLMCRNTISVGWDGTLYDCDFNQMLDIKVASQADHISRFSDTLLRQRRITTDQHCYGCTAGMGSSCGGAITG